MRYEYHLTDLGRRVLREIRRRKRLESNHLLVRLFARLQGLLR